LAQTLNIFAVSLIARLVLSDCSPLYQR